MRRILTALTALILVAGSVFASPQTGPLDMQGYIIERAGQVELARAASSPTEATQLLQVIPRDGWTTTIATWTYASASTFTISGDWTEILAIGTKIRLVQTTTKYFYATAVSHAAGTTTVTVNGGSDYSLANAAITSPHFSAAATPVGFPHWFNWTPTFVGFSANPTNVVSRFTITGRRVTVHIRQGTAGTSNATNFTISAPVTSANLSPAPLWMAVGFGQDNGANVSLTGDIGANSSTITIRNGLTLGTWTSSGNKFVRGLVLSYEI